ncbi:glycosyltransferase [Isoptericola sp. 4D.3]|uniref:Glycosyltransferase n=1 Tax=Isoptericola peretonis TaxID=2918523 RepID=A0ABT0J076_9MICO|nr:glycosyltransferase [Isoptericola sp. 4D.3]
MAAGASGAPREFGDGILGRVTARIYWYLVVGVLAALGCVPTLVLLALLDRSTGNALLVPLCLLPAVPFLAAAVFALHERATVDEPAPGRTFARGLRLSWFDALKLWVPAAVVLGVVATSVLHRQAAGISLAYAVVLGVVGLLVLLWALQALLLASLFSFRARDVARLSVYYLGRRPLVTVGLLALVVVAGGVVWLAGEAVLAVVVVAWLAFLLRTGQPVLEDVRSRFVA